MNHNAKDIAYFKPGCPYCFKFLLFMTEAGLLDQIEIRLIEDDDPQKESIEKQIKEYTGKDVTYPTVAIDDRVYMPESDELIQYYADKHRIDSTSLPTLLYWRESMMPKLLKNIEELNQFKKEKQDQK